MSNLACFIASINRNKLNGQVQWKYSSVGNLSIGQVSSNRLKAGVTNHMPTPASLTPCNDISKGENAGS